ncbi:hypothetical protein ABE28_020015 [Peribacillus muralis]|uniref:Uncharacterized protein n=1 Tax=Peribacillus muralis TaxID=264697 RepID=A0A1B3XTX0_9BACI|nr:hypothetical protein ABE28_020015 [Peribacillus muralis]
MILHEYVDNTACARSYGGGGLGPLQVLPYPAAAREPQASGCGVAPSVPNHSSKSLKELNQNPHTRGRCGLKNFR